MNRFWNIFWKSFGILVAAVLVSSLIAGLITQSMDLTFLIAKQTFIAALGVCGTIGILVPVILFFEDRQRKGGNRVTE
jgi:hypothetical protein